MSFNATLDDIKTVLEIDEKLSAFSTARWNKSVTVKRIFRQRTEITLEELPVILITRPDVVPGRYMDGQREYVHTVRLYCGFHQPVRDLAQEELVEFEEMIEDALLSFRENHIFPELVDDIRPGESINDEGRRPPVYFLVKDVEIDARRNI